MQKRATKLIISLKTLPYKERLRKLKLPTVKYRRLRGDMFEVFKIINMYSTVSVPVRGEGISVLVALLYLSVRETNDATCRPNPQGSRSKTQETPL